MNRRRRYWIWLVVSIWQVGGFGGVGSDGPASTSVQAADWPTFQQNLRRNAVTTESLDAANLKLKWSWRSSFPPQPAWGGPAKWDAYAQLRGLRSMRNYDPVFHPVSVGGSVYFGCSSDDSVRCLDASTGKERWRFFAEGPVRVAPHVQDGRLYFGADDGYAYALNAENGELIWRFRPVEDGRQILNNGRFISRWPCRSGVCVEDGIAYFATSLLPWETSRLCAVQASDGSPRGPGCFVRTFDNQTMEGPLVISPERLIVPQGRVAPELFARRDGKPLGALQGGGGSFVVLTDDREVLHGPGNKQGWITASKENSREKIATYQDGLAMVVAKGVSYLLTERWLVASDYVQRKVLWKIPNRHPYSLVLAGDELMVGGRDEVAAISTRDGALRWTHAVDGAAHGLAVANGRLLVSTDVGAIYAFAADAAQPERTEPSASPPREQIQRHAESTVPAGNAQLSLALGPYLQFTDPGSAIVRWSTDRPVPCSLWLEYQGKKREIEVDSRDTQHTASLTGLGRNRIYRYWIEAADNAGQALRSAAFECDTYFNYTTVSVAPEEKGNRPAQELAEHLLKHSACDQGLCLVWGCRDGLLMTEIARRSRLRLVAVDTDPRLVAELRRRLSEQGLYGGRITVRLVDDLSNLPLVGEWANLVVTEREAADLTELQPAELFRMLRPQGGVAYLAHPRAPSRSQEQVAAWLAKQDIRFSSHQNTSHAWTTIRRGALPGAGHWSHLYGAANNSAFGEETLQGAKGVEDLEVQWIGRPGPRYQADRNGRKPSPLSAGGRLFLQGLQRIVALDAFNGTILWSLEIPDLGRFNMPRDCGNWCADEQNLFVAIKDSCWQIDAATGRLVRVHEVVDGRREWKYDWSYLARNGNKLFGGGTKQGAAFTDFWGGAAQGWYDAKSGEATAKVCSDNVFALRDDSLNPAWNYHSEGVIINSTICLDEGRMFFVECRSKELQQADSRRLASDALWQELFLVALDQETGERQWQQPLNVAPGVVVFHLAAGEKRLVLVSSSADRQYHIYTRNQADGAEQWSSRFPWSSDNHGGHMSRPAIVGGKLYVRPRAFDLAQGQPLPQTMPGGGCGTYACTQEAIFFRSGNVTVWDRGAGKTSSWNRLRPDCWLSTIPAGGMLLSPEGGGGCSCGKWLETSIGFIPKRRGRPANAQ